MVDETAVAATRETYKEATKTDSDLVRLWLDAIAIADEDERNWRDNAKKAIELYRQGSPDKDERVDHRKKFNILHSNIETMLPALYNSTPSPDVRRRFNDDDPAAKTVSDIQERCISYSVDRYDFDHVMRMAASDMELAGRGVTRIRYRPYLAEDDTLADEEVMCEPVGWDDFRRGPGKRWEDVPWIAFRHYLTREELIKLSPKLGGKVNLDVELPKHDKKDGRAVPEVFKRAQVWEIWDKDRREVLFIACSYKDEPIRAERDPLDLDGFFPIPRPLYAVQTSDSLVPVVPYEIYRAQAEELEEVSNRIMTLTRAVKARSLYDGRVANEMDRLERSDDGDSVPIDNLAVFADGSKLSDHVMWMPIDMIVASLEKLYMARDQIKQVIYEITGISDILRGASQAQETATAQSIKQQWGSLRIQYKQQEIQRYARDIFRMKAELFASRFDPQTLQMMSGIPLVPQEGEPPEVTQQKMQVLQLLQSDKLRGFRIDIESDSTIRADMTRNQQNMNLFLQGTAQFAQAMAPIVMQQPQALPIVMEVYNAFARNYKLGRQAELALDSLADEAKKIAQQPPPEDPQIAIEKQKLEQQAKADEAKMALEKEKSAAQLDLERGKAEAQINLQREEGMAKLQLEREMRGKELQFTALTDAIKTDSQNAIAEAKASEGKDGRPGKKVQSGGNSAALAAVVEMMNQLRDDVLSQVQNANRNKRIVRDENGRVSHTEYIN